VNLVLGAREITVDFPGTRALEGVSVEVHTGEVLAVVGANGSGKTTLLSVLCGLRKPTTGTLYDGSGEISFGSPSKALRAGISLVPQEPQLAVTLSCWENVLVGRHARLGITLWPERRRRARQAVREGLPHIDPNDRAGSLRKADRAILGLLTALERNPRLVALDEPTAVLGERSVEIVAGAVKQLRADGGAAILVSHRLRDIMQLATRVIVLVDGHLVHEASVADLTVDTLLEKLTEGRPPASGREATTEHAANLHLHPILTVRNLRTSDGVSVETLDVRAGDIVGLAGLGGSGRTRLLRALSEGGGAKHSGKILYRGKPAPNGMRAARRAGIGYVPEDRAREGVFTTLNVARNLAVGDVVRATSLITPVSGRAERSRALRLIDEFAIRTASVTAPITSLSGGNQQRVVLARVLATKPKLVIADEPTQGVDSVGRMAIHEMLRSYAAGGGAVIIASSEFEELIEVSSRILVIRDRSMICEVPPQEADYRNLVSLATGVFQEAVGQV